MLSRQGIAHHPRQVAFPGEQRAVLDAQRAEYAPATESRPTWPAISSGVDASQISPL